MNQLTLSVSVPDYRGTLPPAQPTVKPDEPDPTWEHAKEAIAQYIEHFGWKDIRDHVASLKPSQDMSYWDSPNYQPNSIEWDRDIF